MSDDRIDALYAQHRAAILAYLLRRVSTPDDAADLLAEVFIVAIKRARDVPDGDGARLWLFGVARRLVANYSRGLRRRDAAVERLANALGKQSIDGPTADMVDARRALSQLSEDDRELITLVAWDGLTPGEAARVLELNPATARSRLKRARRRLQASLLPRQADAAGEVELRLSAR